MTTPGLSAVQAWLQGLAPRERRTLRWAAIALGAALLWSVAIAPAWQTGREAPVQRARLAPQLELMRAMAQEARALSNQAPTASTDAWRALGAATQRHLGPSTSVQRDGDRATLQLRAVPASDLANWLAEVRTSAQLRPLEVQLQRDGTGSHTDEARWSGALTVGPAAQP